MVSLQELSRIAEIEFSDIVDATEFIGTKLRIMLTKGDFIDVWLSRKLLDRFGFHPILATSHALLNGCQP
ncbi:MAG: hypothetical protein B6D58_06180 [candidate division Zixibacteria bacterium 4484_95]|nr:MAG: hypothetical protein B6D58_06180 [candidate division Zixibacteria bacterium 4484_95]